MTWNWASFIIAIVNVIWACVYTSWFERRQFKKDVAAMISVAADHPEKALALIHLLGEAYGVDTEK